MTKLKLEGISFPYPGGEKREDGRVVGTWGSPEHPVVMHLSVGGELREATKAERIAVRRMPEFDWVSTLEVELCEAGHGSHPLSDYHSPAGQRPILSDISESYLAPATAIKPSFRDWLAFAATGFTKAWAADNPLLKRVIYDLRAAMILDEMEANSWKDLSASGAWDRALSTLRSCGLVPPSDEFDNVWWIYCNPPADAPRAVDPMLSAAMRAMWNRPEVRAKRRETEVRPEVKARRIAVAKAIQTEIQNRPEVKAKKSTSNRATAQTRAETPEGKAHLARMRSAAHTPEARAKRRATRLANSCRG